MGRTITFTFNGKKKEENVEPNTLLMNLIREKLSFTGTKYVCGIGECGAWTVLMDGKPILFNPRGGRLRKKHRYC